MPDITREAVERLSKIYLAKVRYHRTKNPYYKEPSQSQITSDTLLAMADRIEELEAKLAEVEAERDRQYDENVFRIVKEAEAYAKLAKAVKALAKIGKTYTADKSRLIHSDLRIIEMVQTTLAALKGEDEDA